MSTAWAALPCLTVQARDRPPSHAGCYPSDVCRQRQRGVFAREGWQGSRPAGNSALAVSALKGQLAAIILCVSRAGRIDDWLAIIFVSGGESGQPDAERGLLKYYIKS